MGEASSDKTVDETVSKILDGFMDAGKKSGKRTAIHVFGKPIPKSRRVLLRDGRRRRNRQYLFEIWPIPENDGDLRAQILEELLRSRFPRRSDIGDDEYAGKIRESMELSRKVAKGGFSVRDYLANIMALWGFGTAGHVRRAFSLLSGTLTKAEILGFPEFRKIVLSPRIQIARSGLLDCFVCRDSRDDWMPKVFGTAEELRERLSMREKRMVDVARENPVPSVKDISIDDFLARFGIRSLEFGKHVPGWERRKFVTQTADALSDLAAVLGIREAHVGDGRLGISFGSRCDKQAYAHYAPAHETICIARNGRPGTIAHEWAHFLYDGRLFLIREKMGWMTEAEDFSMSSWRFMCVGGGEGRIMRKHVPPQEFERCMGSLLRCRTVGEYVAEFLEIVKEFVPEDEAGLWVDFIERKRNSRPKTEFFRNAENLETKRQRRRPYWTNPTELFARTFELFVFRELASRGWGNDFLVNPYERERIFGEESLPRWEMVDDRLYPKREIGVFAKEIEKLLDMVFPERKPDGDGGR